MKLTILDGATLNPGDLSWSPLQELAACTIYDRTAEDQVVQRAVGSELVLTNKAPLSRGTIDALPALKYIGVTATGVNIVDLDAAHDRKIIVTNVPEYGTPSVAQATFALLLELTNAVGHHSRRVREGAWRDSGEWTFRERPLTELSGRTFGIIGLGHIGRAVAKLAHAMGMRVIACSRTKPDHLPEWLEWKGLEEVFRESDVLSLHCPLTESTRHLVNRERLFLMKGGAFLLNTSRGPLLEESAVADALNQGHLAGAGLDVLSTEPPGSDNPLLDARNCVITPHLAWATKAARQRLMNLTIENVRAFLSGNPQNTV